MCLQTYSRKQIVAILILCQVFLFLAFRTAKAGCSPQDWNPSADTGGTGVQAILKDVPLGTKWGDLPISVKSQLKTHANNRLIAFRARWAGPALAIKEKILSDCPTPAMSAAMDDYYRKNYDTVVPPTFSLVQIANPAFRRVLVKIYLEGMAVSRAGLTYPSQKLFNRDWDGISIFDSVRLPDQQTYMDIRRFGSEAVTELKQIDSSELDSVESRLKERVLFDARATAVGAFSGDSKGGFDMESACEMISLNGDVLSGYQAEHGRPRIFANDDEVLREVNAIYLPSTSLKWLDVGTLNSALKFSLCNFTKDDVAQYVGDPASNEVAKGMTLLKAWWIERTSGSPEAKNKCSVYSTSDRAQIWEAFSADQNFNNDGSSSMENYQTQIDKYRADKILQYREVARLAFQQVFQGSTLLTGDQRAQVLAAIDAESAFGQYQGRIASALDSAQGPTNGSAKGVWEAAFKDNVVRLGGNYNGDDPVRPDDEVTFKNMFAEIKAWVSNRYQGYPIEIASFIDKIDFVVNTSGGAETDTSNGKITFGIGTQRSKMEYYSLLIHELRHAVAGAWKIAAPDKSKVVFDVGTAVEGSGVAVEELLVRIFLKETLKNDLAYSLYALDYGIRDARFTATTDATLQKYFRQGCSSTEDLDTIGFTKKIAVSYGLTGNLADTLALRAHAGTQYFQYISAGVQILDDLRYLQAQIDPAGTHLIDPYVLFSCGLNTPRRDSTYVAALRSCMKL